MAFGPWAGKFEGMPRLAERGERGEAARHIGWGRRTGKGELAGKRCSAFPVDAFDPPAQLVRAGADGRMQLGGILTLLVLGTGLGWMWLADRRRSHVVCAPGSVEERPDTPPAIHGVER